MTRFLVAAFVALAALIAPITAIPVPYKSCGNGHYSISSVETDSWPPVIGQVFNLNVSGILDEDVTNGSYKVSVKIDGFPLPIPIGGSLDSVHPVPWKAGDFNFTFSQTIPSEAPSGSYDVTVQAVDQTNSMLFCVAMAFKESSVAAVHAVLPAPMPIGTPLPHNMPVQTSLKPEVIRRHPSRRFGRRSNNVVEALKLNA